MSRLSLLVHPVRSRIVTALADRTLTTRQLAEVLPDVPTPSLYRHVRILDEAGLIVRTGEQKVRGGTERSYTLATGGGLLDPNASFSAEERIALLTNFGNVAVHAYRTYVEAGGEEPARANMRPLYLSPEEDAALRDEIGTVVARYMANAPGGNRQRRLFSLIDQPDYEPTEIP